jgi:uncharacterized DUF497 family protein
MYTEGMKFEWDEAKNLLNYAKHKVSFEVASEIFYDPLTGFALNDVVDGEERWQAIGKSCGQYLLLVIHCYRLHNGEEIIRIISARKVTKSERKRYE